jgi:hypothetical protein
MRGNGPHPRPAEIGAEIRREREKQFLLDSLPHLVFVCDSQVV